MPLRSPARTGRRPNFLVPRLRMKAIIPPSWDSVLIYMRFGMFGVSRDRFPARRKHTQMHEAADALTCRASFARTPIEDLGEGPRRQPWNSNLTTHKKSKTHPPHRGHHFGSTKRLTPASQSLPIRSRPTPLITQAPLSEHRTRASPGVSQGIKKNINRRASAAGVPARPARAEGRVPSGHCGGPLCRSLRRRPPSPRGACGGSMRTLKTTPMEPPASSGRNPRHHYSQLVPALARRAAAAGRCGCSLFCAAGSRIPLGYFFPNYPRSRATAWLSYIIAAIHFDYPRRRVESAHHPWTEETLPTLHPRRWPLPVFSSPWWVA